MAMNKQEILARLDGKEPKLFFQIDCNGKEAINYGKKYMLARGPKKVRVLIPDDADPKAVIESLKNVVNRLEQDAFKNNFNAFMKEELESPEQEGIEIFEYAKDQDKGDYSPNRSDVHVDISEYLQYLIFHDAFLVYDGFGMSHNASDMGSVVSGLEYSLRHNSAEFIEADFQKVKKIFEGRTAPEYIGEDKWIQGLAEYAERNATRFFEDLEKMFPNVRNSSCKN
jgi:hypothetical protein